MKEVDLDEQAAEELFGLVYNAANENSISPRAVYMALGKVVLELERNNGAEELNPDARRLFIEDLEEWCYYYFINGWGESL